MNSSTNKWIIGIAGALLALFIVVGACLAGAAGGYLVARGQFNRELAELRRTTPAPVELPERVVPERGPAPEMPSIPSPEDFPFDFQFPEGLEQLQDLNGALLQEIVPDSPAEAAGLQPGDLITAVDGEAITPELSLADLIMEYDPGDEVTLTVVRLAGPEIAEQEIDVILGSSAGDPGQPLLGVRYAPFFMQFDLPNPRPRE